MYNYYVVTDTTKPLGDVSRNWFFSRISSANIMTDILAVAEENLTEPQFLEVTILRKHDWEQMRKVNKQKKHYRV